MASGYLRRGAAPTIIRTIVNIGLRGGEASTEHFTQQNLRRGPPLFPQLERGLGWVEAGRLLSQPTAARGDTPTWTTSGGYPLPSPCRKPPPRPALPAALRVAPRTPPTAAAAAAAAAARIRHRKRPPAPRSAAAIAAVAARGLLGARGCPPHCLRAGSGRVLQTKDAAAEGKVRAPADRGDPA